MLAWFSLLLAGIAEIIWAVTLKLSDGFSKPLVSVLSLISAGFSVALLAYALKSIPLSVAYPIWVGIGVVGISIIGILWLKEPVSTLKILCIMSIAFGAIGLKVLR